jgi:hypothetical protein
MGLAIRTPSADSLTNGLMLNSLNMSRIWYDSLFLAATFCKSNHLLLFIAVMFKGRLFFWEKSPIQPVSLILSKMPRAGSFISQNFLKFEAILTCYFAD